MQSEHPKLFMLYDKIFVTYKTILGCFLKPQFLELTDEGKSGIDDHDLALQNKIINLDFEYELYHLELPDVYLSGNVAVIIQKDIINIEALRQFQMKCLEFYIESAKQIKYRFPFEEKQQLKGLKFLNPDMLLNSALKRKLPSIAHLGTLFPELAPKNMTEFDREWRVLRNTELPFVLEDHVEVEDFWSYISKLKNGDGSCIFPLLSEFVRTLLCLPHSSVNVERLFSSINLMKTKLRNKLSTKTLTGLLFTKTALLTPCYEVQLSEEHSELFNTNMYDFKNKANKTTVTDSSSSDC